MIIDAKPSLNDPTVMDSPPSYDTLVPSGSRFIPGKLGYGYSNLSSDSSTSHCPYPSPASPLKSPSTPGSSKGKGKASNWFNFGANKTTREVQATVLGLVRDLVREHNADSSAPAGVLQSCADACASYELELSSILQERSIENHTPLYWAIVKRKPDEEFNDSSQIPDLLTALLSHCIPLTADTIADIRLACLVTSDQKLFQRLRMSSEFSTVSGADQMLLGVTQSQDEVGVYEVVADDGAFAVDFVIPYFQKRMMVTQRIELEFIARSRMWKLTFSVAKPYEFSGIQGDSWCVSISLQAHSPPTWLDARLVIRDPHAPPSPPTSPTKSPPEKPKSLFAFATPQPGSKPPIDIRLQHPWSQLEPPRSFTPPKYIAVALQNSPTAATLQYSGTPYIAADEKLRARFEAKLRKPVDDTDCVIC